MPPPKHKLIQKRKRGSKTTKEDVRQFLGNEVESILLTRNMEDYLQRQNIRKAMGVGDMAKWIKDFQKDYPKHEEKPDATPSEESTDEKIKLRRNRKKR